MKEHAAPKTNNSEERIHEMARKWPTLSVKEQVDFYNSLPRKEGKELMNEVSELRRIERGQE
jgi:hypothetical protein